MDTAVNSSAYVAGKSTLTDKVVLDEAKPRRTDKQIWGIYIALCLVSVVELYSASSFEVKADNIFAPVIRHVLFLLVGLVFMLFLQNVHYKRFLSWSYIFAFLSAGFMVYTLAFGKLVNGARRSFSFFGFFDLQPAEMVKISAVLIIAALLSKAWLKRANDVTSQGLMYVAGAVMIACGLLITQGLTNTLLLMGISMSMMLIGGVSFKKLGMILLVFGFFGGIMVGAKYLMKSDTEQKTQQVEMTIPGTSYVLGVDQAKSDMNHEKVGRLATWVNRLKRHFKPDKYHDPIDDLNRQEQYSHMAQAHGGIFGVLPGNSRETARLPLAFSDYIYAIVIEEMGLIGGIVVLILYLWLLARAGRIANRCQTVYPALLAIGMAVFITFQAIFHMSIVTGVFPVSGQPLPLISKGGTSIIITSIALGIMLSVSRFAARKGKKVEIKEELEKLPDEVKAINPV